MPTFIVTTNLGKYKVTAPSAEAAAPEIEALKEADRRSALDGEYGASDLLANQLILGLGDKAAGLAGGIKGTITGEGFRKGFEKSRRAEEMLEERARKASGNRGKAAEITGMVGSGLLAGRPRLLAQGAVKMAPYAATALGRIGQNAIAGTVLGAGFGAGESKARTTSEFAGDVGLSAAGGGVLGGAFGGIMEVGRAAIGALRSGIRALGSAADDPVGTAGRKVFSALGDDAMTPEGAAARMRTRKTSLVNVGGDNTTGLARATSARPGPGRTTMNRALDAQQRASFDEANRAVNATLGGADDTFNRRVAQMVATRGDEAAKGYGDAFKFNFGPKHAVSFDALAKRIPGEAVRNARKIALAEGRPFGQQLVASIDDADNVVFTRAPSLQEWHYIQRGLRSAKNAAYKQGVGEVGEAYNNLHREVLATMDEASPLYKAARGKYASASDQVDALKFGREILNPKNLKNLDTVADEIAAMSAPEREMVRLGLARQIEDLIQNTPDRAGNVINKIFGTPAKREAIRGAFDDATAFRRFEVAMNRIAKKGDVFREVRTGSRTSFVDAEKQGFGALADAAQAGMDTTGGTATTMNAAMRLLRSMGQMDDATAAAVAKIMVETDPNVVLQALRPSANRAAAQAGRDQFMQRAGSILRSMSPAVAGGLASTVTKQGPQ